MSCKLPQYFFFNSKHSIITAQYTTLLSAKKLQAVSGSQINQ